MSLPVQLGFFSSFEVSFYIKLHQISELFLFCRLAAPMAVRHIQSSRAYRPHSHHYTVMNKRKNKTEHMNTPGTMGKQDAQSPKTAKKENPDFNDRFPPASGRIRN